MKNKGLLFILMGLLLALLLLSFSFKINSSYLDAEKKSFSSNAIDQVKNKYSNINSARDYYRTGTIKTFFERVIPFTYSIDENTISFNQKLPLKKAVMRNYFDFINAYKIFVESTDSAIYDKIAVDFEAPKNILWGGADENIVFLIKPQCKKYAATDYNSMSFYGSDECGNSFSISSIKRIDINISVSSGEDYNFLSCDYGGDTNCSALDFAPANSNPFIEINLIDANCSKCDLNSETRKTSRHFDPSANNTITFSCAGSCNSLPITVFLNENNTEVRHSGTEIQVKVQFLFTSKIQEFELSDVNLTLTDSWFNITKTNK